MTIDEAFEELRNYNSATFETRFVTFSAALQLGIEALKAWKTHCRYMAPPEHWMLPGETKEKKGGC